MYICARDLPFQIKKIIVSAVGIPFSNPCYTIPVLRALYRKNILRNHNNIKKRNDWKLLKLDRIIEAGISIEQNDFALKI